MIFLSFLFAFAAIVFCSTVILDFEEPMELRFPVLVEKIYMEHCTTDAKVICFDELKQTFEMVAKTIEDQWKSISYDSRLVLSNGHASCVQLLQEDLERFEKDVLNINYRVSSERCSQIVADSLYQFPTLRYVQSLERVLTRSMSFDVKNLTDARLLPPMTGVIEFVSKLDSVITSLEKASFLLEGNVQPMLPNMLQSAFDQVGLLTEYAALINVPFDNEMILNGLLFLCRTLFRHKLMWMRRKCAVYHLPRMEDVSLWKRCLLDTEPSKQLIKIGNKQFVSLNYNSMHIISESIVDQLFLPLVFLKKHIQEDPALTFHLYNLFNTFLPCLLSAYNLIDVDRFNQDMEGRVKEQVFIAHPESHWMYFWVAMENFVVAGNPDSLKTRLYAETVLRMINGHIETVKYIQSHKDANVYGHQNDKKFTFDHLTGCLLDIYGVSHNGFHLLRQVMHSATRYLSIDLPELEMIKKRIHKLFHFK